MTSLHSFHIPVMGLAFTIDTPVKVAPFGINSVMSLVDDVLIEDMRKFYCSKYDVEYVAIDLNEDDSRAKRITAYLDLIYRIVEYEFIRVKSSELAAESPLVKYIELLEDDSEIKKDYEEYKITKNRDKKKLLESSIRNRIVPGSIDVNIMSKIDSTRVSKAGSLELHEYSDALSSLRGYANSKLNSTLVISAGFNPKLYSYISQFKDFFPDKNGEIKKKLALKVSDFRSASIQGRFLAKRGILVSEFRIESGLNCGGHAFPTQGYLMGPILDQFKEFRDSLSKELLTQCTTVWKELGVESLSDYRFKLTVQGGVGTSDESKFLREYYDVDSVGWGTPFLLVPEATIVDDDTLQKLVNAGKSDLYLSRSTSPMGVPFNNLRQSMSEIQRRERIFKGKPGSPCMKKYLVSDTTFSKDPICTASRKFQHSKIQAIQTSETLVEEQKEKIIQDLTAKSCICHDLAASAYIKHDLKTTYKPVTAICPGPNLAWFSGVYSLKEMVDHIYGRINLLNENYRPHFFLNELNQYIDYLSTELETLSISLTESLENYCKTFYANLQEGIKYYSGLFMHSEGQPAKRKIILNDLDKLRTSLNDLQFYFNI